MLNELKKELNYKSTENGAITHKTSNSYVLDYFAQGSSLRNRDKQEIIQIFKKSFYQDPLTTMKILFYSRDIRGGQGERDTFRYIIKYLADNHTDILNKNIHLISEFGRWDDIYALFDTKLEDKAIELIKEQLNKDITLEQPSLLAKWLKSENTSSKESRRLGNITRKKLGMTPKQYRKTLSELRKRIDIVEEKLSKKKYEDIDYSKIPTNASLKYRKAFYRNDEERYVDYLDSLTKGKIKIDSKTLYPYQLVSKALKYPSDEEKQLLNAMWDGLPDYIGDNNENAIAVVDTSGSMYGTPLEVAISLGLYLAERNKGAFKNHFITFADNPELVEVVGKDFCEKVSNISNANWGMSTDIEATFDLILNTAIKNKLKQEELPSKIFIISDMEFNQIENSGYYSWNRKQQRDDKTLFANLKNRFESNGYKMPNLVFWNVDSRNDNIPMTMNENGVQLVSGANPILFETLLNNEFVGAYEIMMKEIGKERYNCITV
ncbi:DUF2828 family protein [Clostridium perfringens]|jgi:uncharacterized protein with von Willebrand factor type A (vWA) domain|uniref:DUF2828 family protein n=1 Tax=Clostridium perfringens TaxID=1502 RepID=A0AAW4J5V0_CLOPF|nr:DUF2828 family protein [Clostridium perfringens]MBO3356277.1 DUF2828 family protein [Clostridium perfringens]MBO3359382.1 DUF2828 family protein [Clostridium perfringens]